MPPVARTSRLTASTKYTLVKSIKKLTFFYCLQIFLLIKISCHLLSLQKWFNRFVLGVKVRHVNNQILQYKHKHKRWYNRFIIVFRDCTQTSQMMATIDVHWAATTDSFSARTTEWKTGIYFILYFNQCVKDHWSALFHINVVGNILWLIIWVVWVWSVDVESF